MTTPSRIDAFREMVRKNPENHLAHFGLANEAHKAGLWDEAVAHYREYLARYDDEGNAYGKLAESLERLGRADEARAALEQGIAASRRFGHPTMAAELEERLDEMG